MDRIAHPLEIRLAEQLGHGRGRDSGRLRHKDGVSAFLVTAGIVSVMLVVMV